MSLHAPPTARQPAPAQQVGQGLRADLHAITARYAAAEQALHRAQVLGQAGAAEEAEEDRREAMGDYYAAGRAIADLGLLLLRMMHRYRPAETTALVRELLAAELGELADAITRMEGRR